MRLERENDDLAHELVTSKIELRRNLDSAEDSVESLQNQLERCSRANKDLEDENKNIHGEYEQVKEMCRREVKRLESEALRSQGIIDNYKKICTSLNQQLEKQKEKEAERSREIMIKIAECERCSSILNDVGKITGSPVKEVNFANGDSCHLNPLDLIDKLEQREHHIRQIELELAQTKLALVEAQCRNQDLTHQMHLKTDVTEAINVVFTCPGTIGNMKIVAAWFSNSY
ncbi:hypothetical protein AB6A40_009674 [Gnathostoma spinigerum]|uniref:Uncharacterized protein n=1 Tax=Gnathostoma spinigerum TaxID=75299 RepID=A0ABD6F1Y9_9BILA